MINCIKTAGHIPCIGISQLLRIRRYFAEFYTIGVLTPRQGTSKWRLCFGRTMVAVTLQELCIIACFPCKSQQTTNLQIIKPADVWAAVEHTMLPNANNNQRIASWEVLDQWTYKIFIFSFYRCTMRKNIWSHIIAFYAYLHFWVKCIVPALCFDITFCF